MTDVTVAEGLNPATASNIIQVMISKAKRAMSIDTSKYSDEVFAEAVVRGFTEMLNAGMSKILTKDLEGEELANAQDAAYAKAEENNQALMEGKVKHKGQRGGAAKSKHSREVTTEAMRLARDVIKDQIRADGGKPSHFKASDISKWAKELLEADASYYEMATANLETRKATPIKISLGGLKADPELVKKDEARKAKAKPKAAGQLSAKQAGKVAPPRSKPAAQPTAH